MLPPDDDAKSQDAEERKSEDIQEDNKPIAASIPTATQAKSSDDEEDSIPIAACIATDPRRTSVDFEEYKAWLNGCTSTVTVPKKKRPAPRKKKERRQTWAYELAVEGPSTYWEVGVEGKRTRTTRTVSYRDDDARSDSED